MARLGERTGRKYAHRRLHRTPARRERVIVVMGSGAETVARDRRRISPSAASGWGWCRCGCYRPFPTERSSRRCRRRCARSACSTAPRSPGRSASRSILDVVGALAEAHADGERPVMPRSSADATACPRRSSRPAWSPGCSRNSPREQPRRRFTVGINDDVSGTSLDLRPGVSTSSRPDTFRAVFFGLGSDGTVSANKNTIKILGSEERPARPGILRLRLEEIGFADRVAPAVRAGSRSVPPT